jgi:carbonic anhydrase/acetyltransferase-like protein (isoleucine patch superfamily)
MNIHETSKIFPGAHIVGDVTIKENVSVWYNAVIRGDTSSISIGKDSNVQDNCVLHCSPGLSLNIGENVSIGHAAVVHGCTVEDNVLIGMNATILNGAHIGKNSIVAAGAVVTENHEFPDNSLIMGTPGRAVKEISEKQLELIKFNAKHYVNLSKSYDNNFNYIENSPKFYDIKFEF